MPITLVGYIPLSELLDVPTARVSGETGISNVAGGSVGGGGEEH